MANNVVFEDYSVQVKNVIKEKCIAFLYEVGGEIRSQAQRNSRRKTSQTAGSYEYNVDEGGLAVHIGSNFENAIWEEFGTGQHAINGDGRKGYWVFIEGQGGKSSGGGKTYTLKEAKRVMAMLRKKGLPAYYTNGKTANRPLFRAFESTTPKIESIAEKLFGGM